MESAYLHPIVGGCLIGLAAIGLLATHGRIAGIAGMIASQMLPGKRGRGDKLAFLAGVIASGAFFALSSPALVANTTTTPPALVAVAGILIGVGAHYGNGCTSGHAVCGVGRLSGRSVTSVSLFIACGVVAHLVTGALLGGAS